MHEDTPKVVPAAADGEAASSPRTRTEAAFGFACRHPFMTLLLLCVLGLLCLAGVWTYLRLTTEAHIKQELRARGLPTSGLELETWNHPADDGTAEFLSALKEMETLSARTNFDHLINELKPEQFRANEAELNALLRDFEPIRQRMQDAARHEAITFAAVYQNFPGVSCDVLMSYRSYHLTLAQQARCDAVLHNDPGSGLHKLAEGMRLTHKIRAYTLIECLVFVAAQGIAVKASSESLDRGVLDTATLRDMAQTALNPEAQSVANENLRCAFADETICAHDTIRTAIRDWQKIAQAYPQGRVWGIAIPDEVTAVRFLATCDLDYRACMNAQFTIYDLACQPYPRIRQSLDALRQQATARSPWDVRRLLLMYEVLAGEIQNTILSFYKGQASGLELGIACALAADRLEGKDWPVNLDDARFPRDPFTGQPFKLIVNKDAVLIYSLGPDQTDSGKVEAFNKTGDMGGGYIASPGSDDDIVFRLARQPYDAAARAPASIPKP